MRRYYRRRTLQSIEVVSVGGQRAGTADYSEDGRPCRLLVTYLPFRMLPTFMEAVAGYLAGHGEPAATTVEIVTWRPGSKPDAEALAGEVGALLAACPSGPPGPEGQQLRRVNLTVTMDGYEGPEHSRTVFLTFTRTRRGFIEERLHRNLHPMLAERIEIGGLANFALERLPSPEDIYQLRGIAHDNPDDVRLFSFAEVRDITTVRDKAGHVVSVPRLELMGLQMLAGFARR